MNSTEGVSYDKFFFVYFYLFLSFLFFISMCHIVNLEFFALLIVLFRKIV